MNSNVSASVTDLGQLQDHPALSRLTAWKKDAITGAKFDRNEMTITIDRSYIREACSVLKADFNFFSDVTCVDNYPSEPRFQVTYHLLSHRLKERVRLAVKLTDEDPVVESILPVWPAANFFEREVFDLFGVRFLGHPTMTRLMMPDDWKGHPLRKDYPVEGYR